MVSLTPASSTEPNSERNIKVKVTPFLTSTMQIYFLMLSFYFMYYKTWSICP